MFAISPVHAEGRPPSGKIRAALCSRTSRPTGRNASIMAYPLATPVSEQERQEIADLTDSWYREALAILGTVVQARTMAGLPLPPEPPSLVTLSIPRQAPPRQAVL